MEVESINQDQGVNSRMSFVSVMYVRTLESTAESVLQAIQQHLKQIRRCVHLNLFFLKHGLNELFQ